GRNGKRSLIFGRRRFEFAFFLEFLSLVIMFQRLGYLILEVRNLSALAGNQQPSGEAGHYQPPWENLKKYAHVRFFHLAHPVPSSESISTTNETAPCNREPSG